MSERKKDHRAVVTEMMIKDALLTLLHETEYDKISVTALCRTAGITRATFYLHYQNLDEVLDEVLDDALRLTEIDPAFGRLESSHDAYFKAKQAEHHDIDTFLPACQRAASDPKYRVLFLNESMSHIILDKLYRKERAIRIPDIMAAHEAQRVGSGRYIPLYALRQLCRQQGACVDKKRRLVPRAGRDTQIHSSDEIPMSAKNSSPVSEMTAAFGAP